MAERNGGDRLDRMEKLVGGRLVNADILLELSEMILLRSQALLRDSQSGYHD